MRICFPVLRDEGLDSPLSDHFGSTPAFLFIDTESGAAEFVPREGGAHEHGACRPLDSFRGRTVDACVVGGIGGGALQKLQAAGIEVIRGTGQTVRACVEALELGERTLLGAESACAGHGNHAHTESCGGLPAVKTRP